MEISLKISHLTYLRNTLVLRVLQNLAARHYKRVQQALFVVDDGNGNAVCRDTSGGCVPWNIFERNADGSTAVTSAATDFIQGVGIVTGEASNFYSVQQLRETSLAWVYKAPGLIRA